MVKEGTGNKEYIATVFCVTGKLVNMSSEVNLLGVAAKQTQ